MEKKLETKLKQLKLGVERTNNILESGKPESIKNGILVRYVRQFVKLTSVNGLLNQKKLRLTRALRTLMTGTLKLRRKSNERTIV